MHPVLRKAKGIAVALALFIGLVWLLSWLFQPDTTAEALPVPPPDKIAEARELRDYALTGEPPALVVDVDYAEQSGAAWYPKGEAPVLRELVKEGTLPPVRERLGIELDGEWVCEPLVVQGVEGVGNYGGTWHRGDGPSRFKHRLSASSLLRVDVFGRDLVPHLAKGCDVSADNCEFTFHLRRGVRWSDGHPFNADDILYWWDWEANCRDLRDKPPAEMLIRNRPGKVVKVDDYTVKFIFPEAYGAFPQFIPRMLDVANAPAHYLKRFHPTHPERDAEAVERWLEAVHTASPVTAYSEVKKYSNTEHPRMWPWLYRTYGTLYPQTGVRNPYYWVVDADGNQLPYIDRIMFNPQQSKAGAGMWQSNVSMPSGYNLFTDYALYMRNRESNGYQLYHWWSGEAPFIIYPNINLREDAGPSAAAKSRLLADKRFRIALSVAINRQEIIDAVYRGVGEPHALVPEKGTRFHVPELTTLHHEYDPAQSNRLLDELELTRRDSEGYRTLPDGKRLTLLQSLPGPADVELAQFIVNDWAAVGLRMVLRSQGGGIFEVERGARRQDLSWWSGQPNFPIFERVLPGGNTAPGYSRWLRAGGPDAAEGEEMPGVTPPAGHPFLTNIALCNQAITESDPARQKELIGQALRNAAEEVWAISITRSLPALVMVKNGFRNVPRKAVHAWQTWSPGGHAGVETYFWDEPLNTDPPQVLANIRKEILNPVPRVGGRPRPQSNQDAASEVSVGGPGIGGWIAPLVRWLFIGIAVLLLAMVAIRHPYVRKRLFSMGPMLAVISVMVFTIIQLPSGDYTTVRIAQLMEEGDQVQLEEIAEIRKTFHLDKSALSRYSRWMGLPWFTSFEEQDRGLLQGNLGRSMKDNKPVTELVGDRLLLTFLLTLGSVLLTWAIALPIGIFTAVKQYSIGDYAFTAMAFLGMCVPSFLLALVLMVLTGVSGLFSPEFAAQGYWDWARVYDLLKHIWLPVVIIGVSSTAGMIRVMRANLLDELKKPYVVTARAKGLRPTKLLLKYPVRIALNPFVSGIGGLFPALVSGSAIIAIVLGLPTVGPLMLNAVLDQDMYLAGSMLMVLGLLSIFGTLVSDLLLVWLDPRIRYEK